MNKIRFLMAIILLSIMQLASAQTFSNDQCAVIVASRQSIDEVKSYINENIRDRSKVRIFQSSNGWYAIAAMMISQRNKDAVMNELKLNNLIPYDSFCSNGAKFVQEIYFENNNIIANNQQIGKCIIVVGSLQQRSKISQFIKDNRLASFNPKIYESNNGWYAISIAEMDNISGENELLRLKQLNKIPQDSYCSTGENFIREITIISTNKKLSANDNKVNHNDNVVNKLPENKKENTIIENKKENTTTGEFTSLDFGQSIDQQMQWLNSQYQTISGDCGANAAACANKLPHLVFLKEQLTLFLEKNGAAEEFANKPSSIFAINSLQVEINSAIGKLQAN